MSEQGPYARAEAERRVGERRKVATLTRDEEPEPEQVPEQSQSQLKRLRLQGAPDPEHRRE